TSTVPVASHVSGVKPPAVRPVSWQASVGSTLKDTLLEWTTREKCTAGGTWKLAWNTTVNYRIDAPLAFTGSFRSAINDLFILYGTASTPLYAATQSAQCVL
ncbi:pilus assembly protein, partial [Salmonella enterica]|nr:pilus assembly protein [Salmonella enterica]